MNYSLYWNGIEKKISKAMVNEPCYNEYVPCEYALFTAGGSGKLVIHSKKAVASAKIRPLSLGLIPRVTDEHTIEVELSSPAKFSLEVNGTYKGNLLVLASPAREIKDTAMFDEIIHYTAGIHNVDNLIITQSNTLVLVDEGAVVNGGIYVSDVENVTICGHGIITKQDYEYLYIPNRDAVSCLDHLIHAVNCKNLNVYDISLIDSLRWTFKVMNCENAVFDNVNIIGCRGNSDGFDICSSRNVTIERAFVRTWDDSFCVKALKNSGNVKNILFRNSTIWNDFARPMEVGVELQADTVDNIVFRNIDVIHSMTGYPVMGIHHGDHALVTNIVMEDIRLEDIHGGQIFDIRITDSVWNCDNVKGGIDGVTIKDIAIVEEQETIPTRSRLSGFSKEAAIKNVTVENISYLGRYAKNFDECQVEVFDYVENIRFVFPKDKPTLNRIASELQIISKPELSKDGYYHSVVRAQLRNDGELSEEGDIRLEVFPVHTAEYDSTDKHFKLNPNEICTYDFEVVMQAGKYAVDIQSRNPSVQHSFIYLPLDMYVSDEIETAVPYSFVNYYNERTDGFRMAVTDTYLILDLPTNDPITIYTALPVEPCEGEVVFEVEETDFGTAPAITLNHGKTVLAPQLRCPAEIHYVFENAPKVKKLNALSLENHSGFTRIRLAALGLPEGCKNFWIEIELEKPSAERRRYPYTLFHSLSPKNSAHMFGNVIVQ